jgi:predicted neuraminidase
VTIGPAETVGTGDAQPPAGAAPGVHAEFVFDTAPFASAHASTIAETADGLLVAWFGGSREGNDDVAIWCAVRGPGGWSAPRLVVTGESAAGRRCPCWNPVLHREPGGSHLLFYKVGPSPRRWWGMVTRSNDGGTSWQAARRLPDGILGPVKNKPVVAADGSVLCPSSREDDGWRVHIERSTDGGQTWTRGPALNDRREFAAIQPTLLARGPRRWHLLCRTRQGAIGECFSDDDGATWSKMRPATLPNPDSGLDGVTLADGRALLVYNHAQSLRTPLNVAVAAEDGSWSALSVLEDEPGEYSYPSAIAGADGRVHITYTWNRRRIAYAALRPDEFPALPIAGGLWPCAVGARASVARA